MSDNRNSYVSRVVMESLGCTPAVAEDAVQRFGHLIGEFFESGGPSKVVFTWQPEEGSAVSGSPAAPLRTPSAQQPQRVCRPFFCRHANGKPPATLHRRGRARPLSLRDSALSLTVPTRMMNRRPPSPPPRAIAIAIAIANAIASRASC